MVEPSGANPLCATKVTCIFLVSISSTCPPPYGESSFNVLFSLIFREPSFHCTNGQLTIIPVGFIVISLFVTAFTISSDFNSRGVVPLFHVTRLTFHNGEYLLSPGSESAIFGWNSSGPLPLMPFVNSYIFASDCGGAYFSDGVYTTLDLVRLVR